MSSEKLASLISLFVLLGTASSADPHQVALLLYPVNGDGGIPAVPQLLDPQMQTVFLIHGWQQTGRDSWIVQIGQMYHRIGGYNFLTIDWSTAAGGDYLAASAAIEPIGIKSAGIIANLLQTAGVTDWSKVHIVGHSLGGHLGASIAYTLQKDIGLKLGRLTGLDVAAVLYEYPLPNLSPHSFQKGWTYFTDTIHTTAVIGVVWPKGDVDFYVNGGLYQPGCDSKIYDIFGIVQTMKCSHRSSSIYFGQSIIYPGRFIGHKCLLTEKGFALDETDSEQIAEMGEFAAWNVTGVYVVKTNVSAINIQ